MKLHAAKAGGVFSFATGVRCRPKLKLHAADTSFGNNGLVLTQLGTIDSTFGSSGGVLTNFGTNNSIANSVAIASDGKIVAAGTAGPWIAVARYNAEGVLDSQFGCGGQIITEFPSVAGTRWALGLLSDDKIVVAGSSRAANGFSDFALLRYESVSTSDALIGRTTTLVNSLNLPDGTSNSMNSKLSDALAEVLAGNDAEACSSLQDFINYVQAQTGKKISESQAQQLQTAANEIRSSIGCE